jgi:phosphoribosylaminoimidazolecarboxamide formyltransferase/IMP cyclohydrolase
VIVKHNNPCGAAVAEDLPTAYRRAFECDPLSAFGGVIAVNRPVDVATAQALSEQFVEVLISPGFDDDALEALARKPAIRILEDKERRHGTAGEREYTRVLGGLLVQDRDWDVEDRTGMEVVCGRPTEMVWGDLLFAWRVCKHVTSNAIVIARDLQTIGIGAGQMSRVDAVRIALDKAREHGHDLAGAALASDAFFPFADGPDLALTAGVTSFIQPGGSKRDDEVIDAVERGAGTMVFARRRHFRH